MLGKDLIAPGSHRAGGTKHRVLRILVRKPRPCREVCPLARAFDYFRFPKFTRKRRRTACGTSEWDCAGTKKKHKQKFVVVTQVGPVMAGPAGRAAPLQKHTAILQVSPNPGTSLIRARP